MDRPDDATLPEIRAALAPAIAENAGFDGWSEAARDLAADALQVDRDVARLALPRDMDMIEAWFAHVDTVMIAAWPAEHLATLKIRERITVLVEARLTAVAANREALRRALMILAMPQHLAKAARLGWHAANVMWRAAGDTSTDASHYSKRAILMAVYAATTTVLIDDRSDGSADTRSFLRRRIDGIMRFERCKTALRARVAHRPSLSRFIGRLRYPAR